MKDATVTTGYPEIGAFAYVFGGGCTATLVAPRWVLTANHCVFFSNANTQQYIFYAGAAPVKVQQILNFGTADMHTTADGSGTEDVALVLLQNPVLTIAPATIATTLPPIGQMVRYFGIGMSDKACSFGDSKTRYADFIYHGSSQGMTDTGGHLCAGDSGGPVMSGTSPPADSQVWAVNSKDGGGTSLETFGAVVFLSKPICLAMYAQEPHTWSTVGTSLIVPIQGCQSLQSPADAAIHTHEVISKVCASLPSCCDPTKSWDASCVVAGGQAFNSISYPNGCFPAGTGNAWTFAKVGTTGQRYPADFNVFALQGDVRGIPDSYDPVAAGGNVFLNAFSINTLNNPVGLVAGGSVTLTSGRVFGSIFYGPNGTQTILGVTKGTVTQGTPIQFTDANSALTAMSTNLSGAPNQIVATRVNTNLTLSSSSPGLNVFLIHQADLNASYRIALQVPLSSTVIINVDGTAPTIAGAGMDFGGHDPGLVLWNFYQAKPTLAIKYTNFIGSILAPLADAQLVSGTVWGTLVAKSLQDSSTEFYHSPFRNNCLVPN